MLFRIGTSILLAILFVGASVEARERSALSSRAVEMGADVGLFAKSATGGADGGGGNIGIAKEVTEAEVVELIDKLKYVVPKVLYTLETYRTLLDDEAINGMKIRGHKDPNASGPLFASALRRLFPSSGHDVYSEIRNVAFKPSLEGACKDLNWEDKDGSAFNEAPNVICLSASRIATRVNSFSVLGELIAVAIHELAHRMGSGETEAEAIQFVVGESFGSATYDSFARANYYLTMWSYPQLWQFSGHQHLFAHPNSSKIASLCAEIGANANQLTGFQTSKMAQSNALGFQFDRPAAVRALRAAAMQSRLLVGFCDDRLDKSEREYLIATGHDPRKPFLLSDMEEYRGPKDDPLMPEDGYGILVRPRDWKRALYLYLQIEKNMTRYFEFSSESLKDIPLNSPAR